MAAENFGRELLRLVSKRVCRGDEHWVRMDGAIQGIVSRARESGIEPMELIKPSKTDDPVRDPVDSVCFFSDRDGETGSTGSKPDQLYLNGYFI